MKKILGTVLSALALCAISLTGCASSQKAETAGPAMVSSVSHPRTYVLDLADSTGEKTTQFAANNGIYQSPSHSLVYTQYFKYDWPQAGDTIEVHYKGVSNIDLNGVEFYFMDASATANYWLGLMNQDDIDNRPIALNVKAGEEFEGTISYVLEKSPSKRPAIEVVMFYDNQYYKKAGLEKVGKAAKIEWLKTDVDTTNTEAELVMADTSVEGAVAIAPEGPKTFNIELADVAKMFELSTNASDGVIWNYQFITAIDGVIDGDLPQAGDTVNIHWKGTSNQDISTPVMMTLVENTQAVGWWKDLISSSEDKFHVFVEGPVTANETFEGNASFVLAESCVEGISIQMFYDNAEGAKSSMWIFARENKPDPLAK